MAKELKSIVKNFFINLLTKWLEDFFIVLGLAFIIVTTYMRFGIVTGNYSLGLIFLIFGFIFAKK